jgi:hypothetical protein
MDFGEGRDFVVCLFPADESRGKEICCYYAKDGSGGKEEYKYRNKITKVEFI